MSYSCCRSFVLCFANYTHRDHFNICLTTLNFCQAEIIFTLLPFIFHQVKLYSFLASLPFSCFPLWSLSSQIHSCPIHPTRVVSSEALDKSSRFTDSRSAPPEVKIREIEIHEHFSFLKRDYKLESIRVRNFWVYWTTHHKFHP